MNFFQDMISDKEGHASSKRTMAIVSFFVMLQAIEMNLFHKVLMDPNLQNFLLIMILGLSGASTVESMATKNPDTESKTVTTASKTEEVKVTPGSAAIKP